MQNMVWRLRQRKKPIQVAVVGVGSVGRGLCYQCGITPGMRCVAIADIDLPKAIHCAKFLGRDYRIVSDSNSLHDAMKRGQLAVCQDGLLLASCEQVDVLIEASSSVRAGGSHALLALEHEKHVIMMNAEADLLFGPYLLQVARNRGLVYTSCDGDQPGVLSRMIDEIRLWGFDLVMAGNIKGFLDRYSDPTKIIPEADKRGLDYRMCASYTDGSKLCVEMALVANGFGCRALTPGMHGPRASHVLDVLRLFDLKPIRESGEPAVDYVLGAQPHGGVFVVGHCESAYQQSMLAWFPLNIGEGPFYVFYRPYHLIHIEAMACVAEAVLDGRALLEPACGFRTNVYAYAKRDLHVGDALDGIGGYACYGLIENCDENVQAPGLPICLAEDVALKRDVSKDRKILLDDVGYDPTRLDFELYFKAQTCAVLGTL